MKNYKHILGLGALLFLFSLLKLSFIWGSRAFCFSGIFFLAPLLGALGASVGGVLVAAKLLRFLFLGKLFCATLGLPTLAAAWCWRAENTFSQKILVNIVLPTACFVLFIFHPSVGNGFWYGLYWLIPIVLFSQKNTFAIALRSSFVAHAVGSVMWCYTIPMQPAQWIALIPVVAVERLVISIGMVFVVRLVHRVNQSNYVVGKARDATCSNGDGW